MTETWMLSTMLELIERHNKGTGCCNRDERTPDDAKAVALSSTADFQVTAAHLSEYRKRTSDRMTFHQTDVEISRPNSKFKHNILMQKSYQN